MSENGLLVTITEKPTATIANDLCKALEDGNG